MMPGSLRALLSGVIDYAGLFPPAKLDLETSLRNYARYRVGEEAWLVSRFVIPASQLKDAALLVPTGGPCFFSAILIAEDLAASLEQVSEFNSAGGGRLSVDSVEIRPALECAGATVLDCRAVLPTAEMFVEVPLSHEVSDSVSAVAALGDAKVKFRTGGVVAEAFPSVADLAAGISACVQNRVALKATAGLHHPVRHYNESVCGKMHGFINVLAAAVFAVEFGIGAGEIETVLNEENPEQFRFDDSAVHFGNWSVPTERITAARQWVTSIGSCSVEEPLHDLKQLGYF